MPPRTSSVARRRVTLGAFIFALVAGCQLVVVPDRLRIEDDPTTATVSTSTSASSGGAGGSGGSGGSAPECTPKTVATACPASTDCATAACTEGACTTTPVTKGTACDDGGGTVCDGKGACTPEHCTDGTKDANESDVDCGGSCSPCENDQACNGDADCTSFLCGEGGGGTGGGTPGTGGAGGASGGSKVCKPCANSSECVESRWCDAASKNCLPDRKVGETCGSKAECPAGYCTDGVCCDGACDGGCSACAAAKGATKDGTCSFNVVKNAPDPEFCDETHGSCGGACACNAAGMCTKTLAAVQVASGESHTCALVEGGKVKCWGLNNAGQLGLGDTQSRGNQPGQMGQSLPAVDLGTGLTATAIAVGGNHTCALLSNATVKCWGYNANGQLGQGDTMNRGDMPGQMGNNLIAINLGTNAVPQAVVAGGNHTCALLAGGKVKCWGFNNIGQLALADKVNRGDAPNQMGDALPFARLGTVSVVQLALGDSHGCVRTTDSRVKCWGNNAEGQVGQLAYGNYGVLTSQLDDNMDFVDLGMSPNVLDVATGRRHTCVLLDGGKVKCWGRNQSGQLGLGDATNRGANGIGANYPAVDLGTGANPSSLHAGLDSSCARLAGDKLKCWGGNASGQLGLGDTANRGDKPGQMGDALPTLDVGAGVSAVTLGDAHHCAVTTDGSSVRCWGGNASGQLGLGDTTNRGDKPGQMGANLPAVSFGTD
jgi:alpha-tubulin suppressor-like RCC1 family protein